MPTIWLRLSGSVLAHLRVIYQLIMTAHHQAGDGTVALPSLQQLGLHPTKRHLSVAAQLPPMIHDHHPPQRKRLCRYSGCKKVRQTKGLCKFHGGGSRCSAAGCTKTNQGGGFCRCHGGGKKCSVEGCGKGAQRRGLCHGHGGMRYCSIESCDREDRGNGLCASHGGGKKCKTDGCGKLSRKKGLCYEHCNQPLGMDIKGREVENRLLP